jgi:tetratricopeptide (TPR) repeat protein
MNKPNFFFDGSRRAARTVCLAAALLLVALVNQPRCTLLEQANTLYGSGKLAEAIHLYKKASLAGENPALCAYNAANAYYQLDSLARSVVYYRECINAAPGFFKAYLNLAVVYFTLSDMGNCIATVSEGLKLERNHRKAMLLLAAAYRRCGANARSIATFEDIARAYPDMEEPYIAMGEIYRDLDDQAMAIKWFESYPSNGKNGAYVALALADINESTGNLERALYYLGRSFSYDKTKKWTLYRIALTQQKMGDELVALETARSALEFFPDFAQAALLAGTISFSRGFLGEAESYYATAEKLGSPEAVVGLANVENKRKAMADEAAAK